MWSESGFGAADYSCGPEPGLGQQTTDEGGVGAGAADYRMM